MRVDNPLQMNDWGIGKFLRVVLAIHFVLWGVIGLDALGLHIPIIREVIGFIYLTFIPGILILRIFRLHKLGSAKTILFAVGVSVAFVMFIGLLVNSVGPLIGISGPLSLIPLITSFSIITLALCSLSYIRDRGFAEPERLPIGEILAPQNLFLILLPIISILGAFVVRFYMINTILLWLMVLICIVVALAVSNRFIGRKFYPLAITMIALALVYHYQPAFAYLTGPDIQNEYYVFNIVMMNSHWAPGLTWMSYDTMLAVTILPATYANILSMDGVLVFKLIYPPLFALVPLGLYEAYRSQTGEKVAFLASFFFASFVFVGGMLAVVKMQVAMLFFTLLIMLLVLKELDLVKRVALFIIFAFSVAVSHYGLGYYNMFYLLLAWLFPIFVLRLTKQGRKVELLTASSIILCFVATLSWYIYISNAVTFTKGVGMGEFVWAHISEIFNPETRDPRVLQAMGMAAVGQTEQSLQREIAGWFHRITYVMIITGVIRWMLKRREMKFSLEFMGMTFAGLLVMFACIAVPAFSTTGIGTTRTYFTALFFLAPFCILGGETIVTSINRFIQRVNKQIKDTLISRNVAYFLITVLVLIPYFLFNVGFIFQVTGDIPNSLVLGMERLKAGASEESKVALSDAIMVEQDFFSITWLSEKKNDALRVWCTRDGYHIPIIYGGFDYYARAVLWPKSGAWSGEEEAYIYLGYFNIVHGLGVIQPRKATRGAGTWMLEIYNIDRISRQLKDSNRIYANGGSEIYYANQIYYAPPPDWAIP